MAKEHYTYKKGMISTNGLILLVPQSLLRRPFVPVYVEVFQDHIKIKQASQPKKGELAGGKHEKKNQG